MLADGVPITPFHIASNHTLKFEMLYLVIQMGLPIKNNESKKADDDYIRGSSTSPYHHNIVLDIK